MLDEVACARMFDSCSKRGKMLKIQRSSNGKVVFALSGRMDEEHIAELEYALSRKQTDAALCLT
jgi:hypothetical protein